MALVEQRPEMGAYKKICTHYIQSSAVPTLERLGLLEGMMQAARCCGLTDLDPLGLDRATRAEALVPSGGQPAPRARWTR